MTVLHQYGKFLEVRSLACVDNGRVFVEPLRHELTQHCKGRVFQLEDISTPEDNVQIDFVQEKVYIYRQKKPT